ncbi:hypothetical protein B0A49_07041 [Cryomyces minteri]|uniref:Phosphatidylserine decarboxylase proenzyme 2 n=1 Tax=Cryomyces minteri TaxID=331657 RepID=A0A4U0X560_9PEZI|nr:hypothetical protein B0A49_07041 [Cryomyces minteri]
MGEFDVPLEDIFANGQTTQEAGIPPKWYPLASKKPGKKKSIVTGEVQLKFAIFDPIHTSATPQQILQKFYGMVATSSGADEEDDDDDLSRVESGDLDDQEDDEQEEPSDETDESRKEETVEKRKKRMRLARLRKKTIKRAYEFSGMSDVAGVLFLEICKITDLPPERNMTRTSFDMDPFVVTSLGKKTYRTRVIRHNLNPVFEEKLVFQVLRHEVNYSLSFSVVDRDKLSGNDYVGSSNFPVETVKALAPEADPATGLYRLPEPPDESAMPAPGLKKENSQGSVLGDSQQDLPLPPTSAPQGQSSNGGSSSPTDSSNHDDQDLRSYSIPLQLKHKERWEDKHNPTLFIRAKYMPYQALRQQFWRAMLKQYDADDSGHIDKVELTTMLDTLGSTLHDATIDSFFRRFPNEKNGEEVLTVDQAVICLEDQLQKYQTKTWGDTIRGYMPHNLERSSNNTENGDSETPGAYTPESDSGNQTPLNNRAHTSDVPTQEVPNLGKDGEDGTTMFQDDLGDEKGEEHVVEIRECPICHQPRLNKKSDADIVTHIATCASQDWRQVNNIVMAGFVTSSQAQRKWYSKVITKISYGGYKLGANSANILVQDRLTGQINEERMSVYVRLGIRLLYKGLKSRDMEKKRIRKLLRSLSFKQGRKYDNPASVAEIQSFINFHQLDMTEVLKPTNQFRNFNEFFYRQLKPGARPCSAPDQPGIITSPADCRTVVFNKLEDAQRIWVKGREFSVERLLGNAYSEDAKRYQNGALGIFRLAPQDYHRFHIPVDGIMCEPKLIDGEYYTVNPMAIRSTLDVYGENIRVVVPIDSVRHGRVMVICVGAMMVGSTVITRKAGEKVHRAEELGYFKFGGSTILLLFEPGRMRFDDDLVDNSNTALETLIRVGMSIGHSPDCPPHAPDMRKNNPTSEEKQDAKRRIEGSFAPPTRAKPMTANFS